MDQLKEVFDQITAKDALRYAARKYVGKHRRQPRQNRRLAIALGCLAVILLGGIWLYFTPTAHVSIDIDSSLELGINRFDRVVCASGSSKSAQTLVSELDLLHLEYSEAMGQILSCNTVTALLNEGELMDVSVIAPEGEQSARLLTESQDCTDANCYYADPETAEVAAHTGLSWGKYRALQELQELDPSITAEEVRHMTMRQIRDRIDALSQTAPFPTESPADLTTVPTAEPTEAPTSPGHHGQGNGNGHGHGRQ